MTVIAGATVTFNVPVSTPRFLNIPESAGDSILVQDLWDTLSEIGKDLNSLMYPKLIDRLKGGGKNVLTPAKQVGITLVMNNVKIRFIDQPGPTWVTKKVTGGNMTAIDYLGVPIDPRENTNFTNIDIDSDVSAAIVVTGGGVGTPAEVGAAVWGMQVPDPPVTNSMGEFVLEKLLSVAKFLQLK